MVPLAPAGTALALTVRHASPRQERYASCVKLSPDFTVAGGPGRPGPSCQRVGRSSWWALALSSVGVKEGGGVFYAPTPLLSVAVHWSRLVAGAQSGELYHLEVQ